MKTQTIFNGAARIERRQAGRIGLSSTAALIKAVSHADSVTLGSYVLNRSSALVRALEDAARRGARVRVRIGDPYRDSGDISATNEAAVDALRASGVAVTKTTSLEHLKAAVVDGTAYLDDRNWAARGPQTVVVDSRPKDVAAIERALETGVAGRGGDTFALGKRDAQNLERDAIASSRRSTLEVESETLTINSRVEDALLSAAERGHVRLIVSRENVSDPNERPALVQLARNGVEIRVGDAQTGVGNEKFCVGGARAWIGSANASYCGDGRGPLDWGLLTSARGMVRALRDQFATNWNASAPLATALHVSPR
jgi:hypothetical protein